MKYRKCGRLRWQVSEIGFGAWAIGAAGWGQQDDGESLRALHEAIDLGCNFIDTAQTYGDGHSERIIGQVLKERAGERIVATKIPPKLPGKWPPTPYDRMEDRYPEDYLRERVEFSLRNLQTDCRELVNATG